MTDQILALVTGANRGLGKEIVRQLASDKVSVLLAGRDKAKATKVADKLHQSGLAEPFNLT